MKSIKNKRALVTGIIAMIGAFICIGAIMMHGFQLRFAISFMILIAWSLISYFMVFTKKGSVEQMSQYMDERDHYIVQCSSHVALVISHYLLFGCCMMSILLYGIFKMKLFLAISATLCGVLVVMLIILICANLWFEKHQ